MVRRSRGQEMVPRLVVAEAIIRALEDLNLKYPVLTAAQRKELKEARKALEHEGDHH